MLVVHLKPYWREARIDAFLASYQESSDRNPGMHTDSRHRKRLFFHVLISAFLIVVLRAGAVIGSHQMVFPVGLTGFDRLGVRFFNFFWPYTDRDAFLH